MTPYFWIFLSFIILFGVSLFYSSLLAFVSLIVSMIFLCLWISERGNTPGPTPNGNGYNLTFTNDGKGTEIAQFPPDFEFRAATNLINSTTNFENTMNVQLKFPDFSELVAANPTMNRVSFWVEGPTTLASAQIT
jgi:hypothetical protein